MSLRPTGRSTYVIGHRCERSVLGMRRCDQWQVIESSAWRNVQHGYTKGTPSVPSGKFAPSPSHHKRRSGSVVGGLFPSLGELDAATKRITLNTSLAGIHNEGKLGYTESRFPILRNGLASTGPQIMIKRESTEIASRKNRGTRYRRKGEPKLDERNEPGNLGSSVCDDKAPRPANARTGRRSNRSSYGAVQITDSTRRVAAKTEYQVQNITERPKTASGWSPRQEGPDKYPGSGRELTYPEIRSLPLRKVEGEVESVNADYVGKHGTEGEIPRGLRGERSSVKTERSVREEGCGRRPGKLTGRLKVVHTRPHPTFTVL
jgi:hypothetical protein